MKLYNLKDGKRAGWALRVATWVGWQKTGLFFQDLPEFSLTEIDEMLKLILPQCEDPSAFIAMKSHRKS